MTRVILLITAALALAAACAYRRAYSRSIFEESRRSARYDTENQSCFAAHISPGGAVFFAGLCLVMAGAL